MFCFVFVCVMCFLVIVGLCAHSLQFSLRSRTPSINGSIYSPYSSRKVCYYLIDCNCFTILFIAYDNNSVGEGYMN